ncbi:N-acetyltransferase [Micromonospora sp. BL4]|uniref:GNAT family N-acetyltransferase n=1 Tax=Micromonospora sp. BL4 TaxID=2478710 RepID=UPI000EF62FE5|nr:GNAT family protein [Micromonospora sp. BL4]RLP94883.1 N-acetyltransferase [Micromonospora sp. BL4]
MTTADGPGRVVPAATAVENERQSTPGAPYAGGEPTVRLRPVAEADLEMFRRFCTEPGLIGLDWSGFRDPGAPARRFAADGWLGADDGRLIVQVEPDQAAAGLVSYVSGCYSGRASYWEIGIVLLPAWRGRGIGWRAQALLCDYLFQHSPAQRIQAGTHPENVAEQRSLEKAGFQLEGVVRACEFRAGRWRDGYLYSRLRDDPSPWDGPGE